jgi:UrcA family protein
MNKWTMVACVLSAIVSLPSHAAPARLETTAVRLRYDRRELAFPVGARLLLNRIREAALESCGASGFSLNEVKSAAATSRCWRDAVDEAVRSIDEPLLTAAARDNRR